MPSDARRLLVITYHFPPDGSIGGLRWGGLSKYLVPLGWKVAVVTAAPPLPSGALDAAVEWCPRFQTLADYYGLFRRLGARSPRAVSTASPTTRPPRRLGPLRVLRREAAACLTFPDWSRGWMLRAILRTRSLVRRFQPHVVVSSGPPHSAHLVAMATVGHSIRWLIDLRDPWAGPRTNVWNSDPIGGSLIARALLPRLERLAFRAAQGVIVNTPQLAEALETRYPDVAVRCVPNGVDAQRLPPRATQPYPGLGIAYAGTLYGGRNLAPVLQALRVFFARYPEAAHDGSKLRVVGHADPACALALAEGVASLGLGQHVELLGPRPHPQALDIVSHSRLVVVLAQEQAVQIPGKLYESLAMGIPTLVVTEAHSATAVEGDRLGALVRHPSDVEGIARLLEQIWRNGSPHRTPRPLPITYEAIAPLLDGILKASGAAGLNHGARAGSETAPRAGGEELR